MQQRDTGGESRYWPALDGLRGAAVVAVLCFHGGFSWAEGGYLGVSTFFTLSGFLITSLLLAEGDGGAIDLVAFWGRRFRRLMPAALSGVLLAVAYAAFAASPDVLADLRGDVLAAIAYVANWRFALEDASYADLFTAPTPLLHYWSLAIEEQFYIVFPLVMAGAVAVRHRIATAVPILLGGLLTLSVAATFVLGANGASDDRIYYGTDTRMAEVLVGALLALYLRRDADLPDRRFVAPAGVLALGLCGFAWATVDLATGAVYDGGLLVYAVLSGVVVGSALATRGPVVATLSWRPLRALGRISYGVYVYHWPIFLWLDGGRTGLDRVPLFALRVVVTLALAVVSYILIEQPIRRGWRLTGVQPFVLAPVVALAAIIWVAAVTQNAPSGTFDFEAARAEADQFAEGGAVSDVDVSCPDGSEIPPVALVTPRISLLGDSTSFTLATGLGSWARCTGLAAPARSVGKLGCGVGRVGEIRRRPYDGPILAECGEWENTWVDRFAELNEQIIVVSFGPWDVLDRRLDPGSEWGPGPLDPDLEAVVRQDLGRTMDVLEQTGSEIAWLTTPRMEIGQIDGRAPDETFPGSQQERVDRLNELVREEAGSRPWVHAIEFGDYVDGLPDEGLSRDVRPDGVHFLAQAAQDIAYDWLGPQLLDLWDEIEDRG